MAPPGAGVRPEEKHAADQCLRRCYSTRFSTLVSRCTRLFGGLRVPLNTQATHDLQQTGVVGESQLLRRFGDVPFVALQRLNHDLALGFLLLLLERARCAVRGARDCATMISNL